MRLSTMGFFPTPVRWDILRRTLTGMGCMTWQAMCGSGAGIGMVHIRAARKLTHMVLHQARTVCFGAAVGAATRTTAGRRSATTSTRPTGTATTGSVRSSPQVSELNGQSGAGVAARGTSAACLRSGYEDAERMRVVESGARAAGAFFGGPRTGARTFLSNAASNPYGSWGGVRLIHH